MKYSIEFQIASLLLLVLLSGEFFSKKHVDNKGIKIFGQLLVLQIINLIIDIVKVVCVVERDKIPEIVIDIVWRLYTIEGMYTNLVICFYFFSFAEPFTNQRQISISRILKKILVLAYIICSIYIIINAKPVYFTAPHGAFITGNGAYFYTAYSIVIIAISCVYVMIEKTRIPFKKRLYVYIALAMEIIFLAIQVTCRILILGCGLSFMILFLYFTLENPDIEIKEELNEARRLAEEASQAKSTFLANMSHEIRTPLSVMTGMNEMIIHESEDPQILEYAQSVQKAGENLLAIINDILDFSKIESGKLVLSPVNFKTKPFFRDVLKSMEMKCSEKALVFKTSISKNIPSVLYGDDIRLRQIFFNLLTNAFKYTEKGSVTLCVDCEVIDRTAYLKVTVTDTGIGIKPEDMDRIFESFQRLNMERNRNVQGTGLGLTIANQLLGKMGSELKVSSEFGQGTQFSFVLPQPVVDATPMGDVTVPETLENGNGKVAVLDFTSPDAHILSVDDNEMNLFVLKAMLKRTKVQLDSVSSGKAAIEKVRSQKYDIIFLDHMMPEMDGMETLQEMKKIPFFVESKTPVVALTANAILGAKDMYLNAGFSDYLTKPIDTKKLEEILLAYLSDIRMNSPKTEAKSTESEILRK